MKLSNCKSDDDLPLFLNASLVAQVLGVSSSTAYELMHEPGFPVLRVGAAWWCRQESLSGGQRSSPEVPNEEAVLGQA